MLETDSPALGPDKGGVNVPANIVVSAAEVRGLVDDGCTQRHLCITHCDDLAAAAGLGAAW